MGTLSEKRQLAHGDDKCIRARPHLLRAPHCALCCANAMAPRRSERAEMATHTDQKLELLKNVPLFTGLGRRDIEELGRLAEEVDVPAGHVLMREGGSGNEFFVIVDGD